MKQESKAEFLTEAEYEALPEQQSTEVLETQDWEKTMEAISQPQTRLAVPRNKDFSRKDVVTAFQNAFELIGGTSRLALWAHHNEGDFFKLYSRLLPSQASSALGEANEIIIKHVLPRGKLDEWETQGYE